MAGVISTYMGWRYNFYIVGCFALLLTLLWMISVYDTPEECPRISEKEVLYIHNNTIKEKDEEMVPKIPPYFAMAKSVKVWAGVCIQIRKFFEATLAEGIYKN